MDDGATGTYLRIMERQECRNFTETPLLRCLVSLSMDWTF